jgi:hypothetical protein
MRNILNSKSFSMKREYVLELLIGTPLLTTILSLRSGKKPSMDFMVAEGMG